MNLPLTEDEKGWFRPPQVLEMCRRGDRRRFLMVAEPNIGSGVYGVGWEITESLILEVAADREDLNRLVTLGALVELRDRIARNDSHGEGSDWEVFIWTPALQRNDDNTISIQTNTEARRDAQGQGS